MSTHNRKRSWLSQQPRVPQPRAVRSPFPEGATRVEALKPRLKFLYVVIALSALLRFIFLPDKSLWLDEAFSVWIVQLDWANFLSVLSKELNMSLYYLLLRFWLILGESEFILRSLSVISAVATVPVLYALGSRLFGVQVGLLGALLLALNAFHIRYAQEARSYSLLVFLVTLSSFFFVKSIEQPARRHWIGYILTSVLGVYSHFFAALVPMAHYASLAFLSRREVPWKGLVWSILSIGSLTLPLVVLVLTGDIHEIGWIPKSGLLKILHALSALAGAGGPLLLIAYFIPCFIALFQATRAWSSSETAFQPWPYGFLLTWLFMPITLVFAVSIVNPLFSLRYLIICLPPLILLAAVGISSMRPGWVFVGTVAVVVSLATHGIFLYYKAPKEDWRAATQYILLEEQSGDAALFYRSFGLIPFDYYRSHLDGVSASPAIEFPTQEDYSTFYRLRTRRPSMALIDHLPSRYSRVWLVLSYNMEHDAVSRSIQVSLANHYHLVKKMEFTKITILLYGNTPIFQFW